MARSTFLRRAGRVALVFLCLILVLALAGAVYQIVATRIADSRYPPPGRLVDVGARKMHINCTGSGSPTVILEAGLGGGAFDWDLVQPTISKTVRVCSYDRAGIAWSDPAEGPRDSTAITDDLHRLLEAAGVTPPYVLVGHSIGGVHSQLFASKYPNEVAGMVLVDSSHEDQLLRYPGIPSVVPWAFRVAAPIGVARIFNTATLEFPNLSPEMTAERIALCSRTSMVFAVANEMTAIPDSLRELERSPLDLGSKPLVVIARGSGEGSSPDSEAVWRDLQTDLAKRSTSSRLIVATKSPHYVQFFEPEIVIDSILQVVEEAK